MQRAPHALVLLALLALASCGYSTRRLEAFPRARTIAVLPFTSSGFRRDVDLRLTQAVVEEIRARTSYAFAAPTQADLVLSGTMSVGEAVLLQRGDRLPIEKRLQGSLAVTVRDRRTGRVVKQYDAYDTVDFTPDLQGETLEGFGYDAWTRRVAIRVAQGLEAGL